MNVLTTSGLWEGISTKRCLSQQVGLGKTMHNTGGELKGAKTFSKSLFTITDPMSEACSCHKRKRGELYCKNISCVHPNLSAWAQHFQIHCSREGFMVSHVLLVLSSAVAVHVHHMKSSSSLACPALPRLTLDQYVEQTTTYFTDGAVFEFLPGKHHLQVVVNLTNVSDVVLRGKGTDIWCENKFAILFEEVRNLSVEGLKFSLSLDELEEGMVAFKFLTSHDMYTAPPSDPVLLSKRQLARVIVEFSMKRALACGMLDFHYLETLCHSSKHPCYKRSVFINNEATGLGRGGAIYSRDCTLVIICGTFIGISAKSNGSPPDSYGGAIYVSNGHLNLQCNVFSNNSASYGGAIFSNLSNFNTACSALFFRNEATKDGGPCFYRTQLLC